MFASFNARALGRALTPDATVDLAARAGFGGVDFLVRDLVDGGWAPKAVRRRLDDAGLRAGAWPLPVDWRGERAAFVADLGRLPRYAEAAAQLGLRATGTWVMPEIPARFASLPDAAARRDACLAFHVERLGHVARCLDRFGVRLGLEVIGVRSFRTGTGDPFLTRLADVRPLLALLRHESPNVGVLVDGFHLHAAGEGVTAGHDWAVDEVVWVHVADTPADFNGGLDEIRDNDRGLPGDCEAVGTRALLHGLAELGYDGPVTPEPMAGCRILAGLHDADAAQRLADATRAVWPGERLSGTG